LLKDYAPDSGEVLDADSETKEDLNDPIRAFGMEALTRFSSNRATQSNSYFPLGVDDRGLVRLDFDNSTGKAAGMKQGIPNQQFGKMSGFASTMDPGVYEAWKRADEADRTARAALDETKK
jgi:hypothetical protein